MKKISIARALKEKNRLIHKINDAYNDVVKYNTVMITEYATSDGMMVIPTAEDADKKRKVDVLDAYTKWHSLREKLIELKTKIQHANIGIIEQLIRIDELKGALNNYRSISSSDDIEKRSGYVIINSSKISRNELVDKITETQEKINNLQDEIDEYNAKTFIEIEL